MKNVIPKFRGKTVQVQHTPNPNSCQIEKIGQSCNRRAEPQTWLPINFFGLSSIQINVTVYAKNFLL